MGFFFLVYVLSLKPSNSNSLSSPSSDLFYGGDQGEGRREGMERKEREEGERERDRGMKMGGERVKGGRRGGEEGME